MRTTKTAWELAPWMRRDFVIRGAEGEGGDGAGGDGAGDGDGEDGEDDEDGGDGEDDNEPDDLPDDRKELKNALAKERKERRDAEKAKRTAEKKLAQQERQRSRQNQSDAEALQTAKKDLESSQTREKKLAEGFKKLALNRAIEKAASKMKFRDTDDALAMVDRSLIDVDQDEDEPDKVDIDDDSVKRAVKKLADAKKHLLQSGTEDDGPTGSQFGSNRGGKKPSKDEELVSKYSALQ